MPLQIQPSAAKKGRLKIAHICLANYFADDQLYQENQLVREHVAAGHDVTVIASTETFDASGEVAYIAAGDYVGAEGARVIRLPYRRFLPKPVMRKLRLHPGLRRLLTRLEPDVIMFHGIAGYELLTVSRYARKRPSLVFHIDSHADAINSGRNWLSRSLLHRLYYRPILRRAMGRSGPLLCVSLSVMEFAATVYGVPRERLEFFPLGGHVPSAEDYAALRGETRSKLGLRPDDIMIVQSGKLDREKRLPEALRAFGRVTDSRMRLFVAGVLQSDIEQESRALIAADPRVSFLGWQDSDALHALLCAADLYLQPGRQSATMQHSLCCSCPVILRDETAHGPYVDGNGWLIRTEDDIAAALTAAATADLPVLGNRSKEIALRMLDYSQLARRVLRP